MSERDEAIREIHAAISERTTCTLEDYRRVARDWVVVPIKSAEVIVGGILIRHNELHLAVTRTPCGATRRLVREVLERCIHIYGSAVTIVYRENTAGLRFCERLGFRVTWEDEETIHLRIERCRYA